MHFALDPNNPANKAIVDLDRAPRNAQGLVEFSSDLRIVRPKDPAKRNGTMIMEVVNRGHSSLLTLGMPGRSSKIPCEPRRIIGRSRATWRKASTLVWVGWEFDLMRRTPNY